MNALLHPLTEVLACLFCGVLMTTKVNSSKPIGKSLWRRISLGEIETITARTGEVLQLRPKAADGSVLIDAIGKDGSLVKNSTAWVLFA